MKEQEQRGFVPLGLEQQAEMVAQCGVDTLMFCPRAWALRHRFIHRESGNVIRARCGSWRCLYCGPRKVDMWRQLVKAAEPTLFVTLTKVGMTLEEAGRVLTTVLQYLRRGCKGRGKNRVGARPAYAIQVFAVLEEHSDFAENGFHWHLLVKGVDFLPNQVVSDALRSATKGRSYITKVKRIKNQAAVGYVTKYLTKEIMRTRRGLVEEQRVVARVVREPVTGSENAQGVATEYRVKLDDQGDVVEQEEVEAFQRLCKAHRIRYSKQFFPMSTAALRRKVFGEQTQDETQGEEETGQDEGPEEEQPSPWMLYEVEPGEEQEGEQERRRHEVLLTRGEEQEEQDEPEEEEMEEQRTSLRVLAYQRMRRQALLESLEALREGKRLYSRRVISIWNYQRGLLRLAG